MDFMVRPFEKRYEREAGGGAVSFSGRLDGGVFVVRMAQYVFPVPIQQSGRDAEGEYAIIEEMELQVGARWAMLVEPEPHEEWPESPGCHIAVRKVADRRPYEEAARRAGLRLGEVELVVPLEAGASVYFDSLGHCNGVGYDEGDRDPDRPTEN